MKEHYFIPLLITTIALFLAAIFFIVQLNKQKRNKLLTEKHKRIFGEKERTMSQVSKEVHDNLGGLLNIALMNIKVIKQYTNNDEQKEAIENTEQIIAQLIADVHNISRFMNSSYIKSRGLFDILKSQLQYIAASKNIACNIEVTGEENILSADEELLVYRIAQEAIQNTLKHSQATDLAIFLNYDPHMFTMTISDNGIGFNKQDEHLVNGLGLTNMQERANILNSVLSIRSAPNKGCTIILEAKK